MRKVIAAAWVLGGGISVLVLASILLDCCVLPFHHAREPICAQVAEVLSGHHHSVPGSEAASSVPSSSGRDALALKLMAGAGLARTAVAVDSFLKPSALRSPYNERALRSVFSLGSLRVDDDVGLHQLFSVFLL